MNEYFLATLSISIFLAVIDLLLSKTQNAKLVRSIISLILVAVLAVPIINIIENRGNSSEDFTIQLENKLILIEKEAIISKIENELNLNDIDYKFVEVEIAVGNFYSVKKVKIYLDDELLISEIERTKLENEIKMVLKKLIIKEELIEIE